MIELSHIKVSTIILLTELHISYYLFVLSLFSSKNTMGKKTVSLPFFYKLKDEEENIFKQENELSRV